MHNVPIVLTGTSGKNYSFPLNPIDLARKANLPGSPAVYVITKTEILYTAQRDNLIVHVGETDNKNTLLKDLPSKDCIEYNEGDQIAFIDVSGKEERTKIVKELQDAYEILC